ncbi:reverse transcriptase domain-containing protein [Tanacetum coccineum]
MREVHYHDWFSNSVMVKKHDSSWRMCVDFTDLNKSCPKDCYPLPEIDWKVKSLCGYPFKCFLDAYKGYHQIQMAEEDEEKTVFHTNKGVFCYTKMSFGLKNVVVTYQRLMDKAFEKHISRNLEVINMKLNPKKCTFGAEEGAFLGHVVSMKGIKACPEKAEAVMKLRSPRTLKEAQSLNEKLASLNRFLSKSAEKSLPIFKTLKRTTNGNRTETQRRANNVPLCSQRRALSSAIVAFCFCAILLTLLIFKPGPYDKQLAQAQHSERPKETKCQSLRKEPNLHTNAKSMSSAIPQGAKSAHRGKEQELRSSARNASRVQSRATPRQTVTRYWTKKSKRQGMRSRGRTSMFQIGITDDDNDNPSNYATKGDGITDVNLTTTILLPIG